MSKLIKQAKQARNRGSKRQVDIDAISNLINAYEANEQELSDNNDILVEMEWRLKESEAECERLRGIIKDLPTITTDMKAECIGEFREQIEMWDEDEGEYLQNITVGWDTTKEIYAMMLNVKLKEQG